MRNRPRLLVTAVAATVLCAVLWAAVVAPLQAGSQPSIRIKANGERYPAVTAREIREHGDKQGSFKQLARDGSTMTVEVDRGMSLRKLLDFAGVPSSVGVIELQRKDGSTYFVDRSADLVFWFDARTPGGAQMHWFRESNGARDVNKPDEGFADVDDMRLEGHSGNLLDVEVDADPERPRVNESVELKADADGAREGEDLSYDWDFGDGETDTRAGSTTRHTYDERQSFTVTVTVRGDKGSRGVGTFRFRARKAPERDSGSGGSPGGGSRGGSGGGGSGGGSGGGGSGGGVPPASTIPPFDSGAVPPNPTTPALPPPSTSPPSDPGRGPSLDPNAPPTTAGPDGGGQRVEGILVSANVPPRDTAGDRGGNRPPDAAADKAKNDDGGIDWKAAGGVGLPTLLVLLGALTERRQIRRLLPQPQ